MQQFPLQALISENVFTRAQTSVYQDTHYSTVGGEGGQDFRYGKYIYICLLYILCGFYTMKEQAVIKKKAEFLYIIHCG